MPTTPPPVVLTSSSIGGRDEEVVESNAAVVDAMHHALLRTEDLSPVAVRSYLVDLYVAQVLEGGFAQYTAMAGGRLGTGRPGTDRLVREGMQSMGATAHLRLFERALYACDVASDGVFRAGEFDGEFEELLECENITALNAGWLRSQPNLLVLDDEEVGPYIHRLAALVPGKADRNAAGRGTAASPLAGSLRDSRSGPAIRNPSGDLGPGKEISGRP